MIIKFIDHISDKLLMKYVNRMKDLFILFFKLFLQTDLCTEASSPDLGSGGSISQNLVYSNCQEMNNAKPILPSNCVSPTEFSESNINDREMSDKHIDNVCPCDESTIKHNLFEYSDQQDQNIKLSKNMDMSSVSLQQGRVAKLMRYKYIRTKQGK